jgi:hypothetical protein
MNLWAASGGSVRETTLHRRCFHAALAVQADAQAGNNASSPLFPTCFDLLRTLRLPWAVAQTGIDHGVLWRYDGWRSSRTAFAAKLPKPLIQTRQARCAA